MNISNNYNNNIYFSQKVPTSPLLKMGSGIFNYEDAKNLCHVFDQRFPGHIGYYQKALHYVEMIRHKNPEITEVLTNITRKYDKNDRLKEIARYTQKLGEEIDVKV